MFALTSSMAYYLCPHDVDMRKGIYSLYQLVKSDMGFGAGLEHCHLPV